MTDRSWAIRILLFACRFMVWASAVIVLGLTAWAAVHIKGYRVIYPLSVGTIVFYIPGLVLSLLKRNHGYTLPIDIIFSFLWLAAFIFLAQHVANVGCRFFVFSFSHGCARKNTAEAFAFLAFFFALCSMCIEILNIYDYAKSTRTLDIHHEKHPLARNGGNGAPPAPAPTPAATGTNGTQYQDQNQNVV